MCTKGVVDVWLPLRGVEHDMAVSHIAELRRALRGNTRYHWRSLSPHAPTRRVLVRRTLQPRDDNDDEDDNDSEDSDDGEATTTTAAQAATRTRPSYDAALDMVTLPQYVWPAAQHMCAWLVQHRHRFAGKTVLELGCGTGVVGFVAANCAATVVLSDCSHVALALVQETIAAQPGCYSNCMAAMVRWGDDNDVAALLGRLGTTHVDVVIGSDIFYFHTTLQRGLRTARLALQHGCSHRTACDTSSVFLCGSVVRSERMEHDMQHEPAAHGFASTLLVDEAPFQLYEWRLQAHTSAASPRDGEHGRT